MALELKRKNKGLELDGVKPIQNIGRKKKSHFANVAYTVIGLAISGALAIQPVFSSETDIFNKLQILSATKGASDISSNSEVIFEDKYADTISTLLTYTNLIGEQSLSKTDINKVIVSLDGTPSSGDTLPNESVTPGGVIIEPGETPPPGTLIPATPNPSPDPVKPSATPIEPVVVSDTLSGLSTNPNEAFKNVRLSLPLAKGTFSIVSTFGDTILVNGLSTINNGTDFISTTQQASVYASLGGTVSEVATATDEKGLYVIIKSTAGNLSILYGQLSTVQVAIGDYVQTGMVIGVCTQTNTGEKSKLHYEIFDTDTSVRFDPEKFKFPQ